MKLIGEMKAIHFHRTGGEMSDNILNISVIDTEIFIWLHFAYQFNWLWFSFVAFLYWSETVLTNIKYFSMADIFV